MAGLYQRTAAPNLSSPAMQLAASQGSGGAIPRGGAAAPQQRQEGGINAAQLGGLLGMMKRPGGDGVGEVNFTGGSAGTEGIAGQMVNGANGTGMGALNGVDFSGGLGNVGGMTGASAFGPGIPGTEGVPALPNLSPMSGFQQMFPFGMMPGMV